jgi:hypothetical protein
MMTPRKRTCCGFGDFNINIACGIGGVSVSLAASRIAKKIFCWKRFKNSIIVPPVLQGMPVFPNDMALLKGRSEHP